MDSTQNSIRLQVKSKKNGSVPASEFEKQLARLQQKDDTILKAKETSDHLVNVVLASSRWLQEESTKNSLPGESMRREINQFEI